MSSDKMSFMVKVDTGVLQRVRQHARTSMEAEICGVLIGQAKNGEVFVENSIQGDKALEGGAHVTFTQATWEHIYQIKDKSFSDKTIVGWYHSHPGFGVFLSDYDLFIHQNFFSAPHQLALVFDPHSDEEGMFGWKEGKISRLGEICVCDRTPERADVVKKEPELKSNPDHLGSKQESTPAVRLSAFSRLLGRFLNRRKKKPMSQHKSSQTGTDADPRHDRGPASKVNTAPHGTTKSTEHHPASVTASAENQSANKPKAK
jgi:proteasome lid subunit RPN8/RPN11